MTDHPGTRQTRGGPARWALHTLLVLAVACSSPAVSTTSSTVGATTSTSTTRPSSTTIVATTTGPDPASALESALAATSPNYRYVSVVTVGDQTITTIEGVVDGESVAAQITTGSSQASYIRTPEGEWVAGPDEEWSVLEGEAPALPPLTALSDATDLEVAATTEAGLTVLATLGPAAGPVAGTRVEIVIAGDRVMAIRYQAETGAGRAQVSTEVTDVGEAGTVEAPAV